MLKRNLQKTYYRMITNILFVVFLLIFFTSCTSQQITSAENPPDSWITVDGIAIVNNRNYAPACLKLIKDAKKEILLMLYQTGYYEYYPGSDSNILLEALLDALKRDVKVTAIIDLSDWNEENMRRNAYVGEMLLKAGASVYFDNPKLTSHQKVLMTDNRYSVVASANWTHYSLRVNNEVGVVVDSKDLYKELFNYFKTMEKEGYKYDGTEKTIPIKIPEPTPVPPDKTPYPPPSEEEKLKSAGKLNFLKADGIKLAANRDYAPEVINTINLAKKNVRVVQMDAIYYTIIPYRQKETGHKTSDSLSPTNDLYWALVNAKKRGVDVSVILDVQEGKEKGGDDFAARLISFGIDVYYDDPQTTTHAKMLTIDDEYSVIGSTNWSYNATAEGNEVSVLIKSKDIAAQYNKFIDEIMKKASKVDLSK